MSVEDSSAVIEQNTAPVNATESTDDALGAVWDRLERDNGAARDDSGKFVSSNPDNEPAQVQEPLEGGEGEAAAVADTSTPEAVEVPLPSNWRGLEETWSKIPAELRDTIKAHEDKLHQTLSQQGQALSAFKPIGDVIQKYGDYFDGRTAAYKPADAVEYLFNLQRQMDANPVDTLLQIADTYQLRPHLAQMFGGQAGEGQTADNSSQVLLAEINQLKTIIRDMGDPSKIDARISSKLSEERQSQAVEDEISRVSKDMPLYADIPEEDMVHFINRSWAKLGNTASREAVLKSAYDMAINADPDLRAKAAALKSAATHDPARVAAAKRANESNIRSTSSGKTRDLTDDELLGQVFDKNQRG